MKTILIILTSIVIIYAVYRVYRHVKLDNGLEKKIANGAIILDVRTKTEFDGGHILDAVNIPLSHLRKDPLPFNKNQEIITCCSHGLRSVKAVGLLKERGYNHVYNGGVWTELNKLVLTIKTAKPFKSQNNRNTY